jgi:hypothetical protein
MFNDDAAYNSTLSPDIDEDIFSDDGSNYSRLTRTSILFTSVRTSSPCPHSCLAQLPQSTLGVCGILCKKCTQHSPGKSILNFWRRLADPPPPPSLADVHPAWLMVLAVMSSFMMGMMFIARKRNQRRHRSYTYMAGNYVEASQPEHDEVLLGSAYPSDVRFFGSVGVVCLCWTSGIVATPC